MSAPVAPNPDAVEIVCGASHVVVGTAAAVAQAGYPVEREAAVKLIVDAPVGFALATLEQADFNGCEIVVTTVNCCPEYVEDLWDGQPHALLAGQSLARRLPDAIEHLRRGERYRLAPGVPTTLTPGERLVLRHLARGRSNAAIARYLGLRERTVMNTLTGVYAKLGVESRAEALLYYWGIWRAPHPHDSAPLR